MHTVRFKDWNIVIKNERRIFARWTEHLYDIFSHISSTDFIFIDILPYFCQFHLCVTQMLDIENFNSGLITRNVT